MVKGTLATTPTYWCDSDWVDYTTIKIFITGYMVKFDYSLISEKSKKQQTVSRSLVKAEYRSMALGVAKITWVLSFFTKVRVSIQI